MSDLKPLLIKAAIAPLANDEEMKVAASRFLGERIQDSSENAEEILERWQELDFRKRRIPWRHLILGAMAVATGLSFCLNFHFIEDIGNIQKATAMIGEPNKVPANQIVKTTLTPQQQLILYGDTSKALKSERCKALADSHPTDAAYYSQYAEHHLAERNKLPQDFLVTAQRVAPDNAWFTYLFIACEVKGCVKKISPSARSSKDLPKWEITDQRRFDEALRLLKVARAQSGYDNYSATLTRQKIHLLPQATEMERVMSMAYISSSTMAGESRSMELAHLIAAQASSLMEKKSSVELQELVADFEALINKRLSAEATALIPLLVTQAIYSGASKSLVVACATLDLPSDKARLQFVLDGLNEKRSAVKTAKTAKMLVNGHRMKEVSGFIPSVYIPMIAKQVGTPPTLQDDDVKPGRLTEHEKVAALCSLIILVLMAFCSGIAWSFRWRLGNLTRALTKRMTSLLKPYDWFLLIGLGVIFPIAYAMVINRYTPLGGRDLGLTYLKFKLPSAHFVGMAMLLVLMPVTLCRWRLARRASCFGFNVPKTWIGWLVVSAMLIYIPLMGWAVIHDSRIGQWVAVGLQSLALIWLLCAAARAFGNKRQLQAGSTARTLVSVYATAAFAMALAAPCFKAANEYWFRKDTLMTLSTEFPSMTPYEYKAANQLQSEIKQIIQEAKLPAPPTTKSSVF